MSYQKVGKWGGAAPGRVAAVALVVGGMMGLVAAPLAAQVSGPIPLSLAEAVARAAEGTAGVALAGLQVEEAEARADEARSALLPDLSARATGMNRTYNLDAMGFSLPTEPGAEPIPALVGPFPNVDARLSLSQTLFDPASYLRTRAAGRAVEGSTAGRQLAREAAATRAASAYLRAGRAQALLSAREADASLAAELLELAEQQLQAGVSPAIDVTRARTRKVAADGEVLMARNAAEQAQIELARALGADPASRFVLSDTLGAAGLRDPLPGGVDSAVALALVRRPELRQVEAQAATARIARQAIRAERLPRVGLFADYGASGLHVSDAIATREVGLQVSVPLFDGLRREARLSQQGAALEEAVVREEDLKQQIAAEVRAALLERENGIELRTVAEERLQLAEEELSQARERFANGVAGNIELIQAQGSLNAARDAVIAAHFAIASADAALARAVGVAAELR